MSDWFYAVDGVQYGPVTEEELRGYLGEGRVRGADLVWRDGMPEWVAAENITALAPVRTAPFFAVGTGKLLVMFFATLGFYELYWMYWQWRVIKERTDGDIWPVARSIFAIFFFHALQKEIVEYAQSKNFTLIFPAGLSAFFVIATLTWRLPDPWWMLSLLAIIPVAMVQRQINALHAAVAPYADRNDRLRGWNWVAVGLGVPLWLLVFVGMFMPAE